MPQDALLRPALLCSAPSRLQQRGLDAKIFVYHIAIIAAGVLRVRRRRFMPGLELGPAQARARLGSKAERRNKTEREETEIRKHNKRVPTAFESQSQLKSKLKSQLEDEDQSVPHRRGACANGSMGQGRPRQLGLGVQAKAAPKLWACDTLELLSPANLLPKCSKKENKLLISRSPQSPYALQETGVNDRMATQHAA